MHSHALLLRKRLMKTFRQLFTIMDEESICTGGGWGGGGGGGLGACAMT